MKKRSLIAIILFVLLSGCNTAIVSQTSPTISVEQVQLWAKQTIEALGSSNTISSSVISILPQTSPTPKPVQLSLPTAAPTAIPTIQTVWIPTVSYVQPVITVCDRMRFIEDVTIEDNTVLAPNQVFRKTWRIQNIGSCTWSPAYQLVFDNGNSMSGPAAVNISKYVAPNETVEISLDLRAPGTNGEYQGNWVMRSASGTKFGTSNVVNNGIWVKIIVKDTAQVITTFPGEGSNGNCSVLNIFPAYNTSFYPNQETDFSWTVRNDSGVIWTVDNFDIAYVGGTNMLKRQDAARRDLPYDVYPGNPLSFTVDAVIPSAPGSYTMTYGVVQNFEIICNMDVTVYVTY
ncbi:MAG: NBR1-Ig-like domain-containing protein [Flexilinea sp.]